MMTPFKDKKAYNFEAGEMLLIDKPLEWTSFDAVKKIRSAVRVKKVGHAGTLDPLATGLLIICTGRMTKKLQEYQALYKEYTACLRLGQTTPSFDLETAVAQEMPTDDLTEVAVKAAVEEFVGEQEQLPPVFSAVKVDGKRAYKSARKGKEVKLEPRPIHIYAMELISWENPELRIKIACSKGTYIRSLARDIGEKLGVGAHLQELRRTAIGTFRVEDALDVREAADRIHAWRRAKEEQA